MNVLYDSDTAVPFLPPRIDSYNYVVPGCVPELHFVMTFSEARRLSA